MRSEIKTLRRFQTNNSTRTLRRFRTFARLVKMTYIKDNYYHIFNRGCNREPIFFNKENYLYLLRRMKATISKSGVSVIAYCLMPNHYHFLVRQLTERPLSNWIRDLFNGYTQAINRQQQRSGTLFEGRAKHRNITDDDYLLHLICYIHGNPMDSGLADFPENWEYSNYRECAGIRKGMLFDQDFFNARFDSPAGYREFFENYYLNSETRNEFKDVFNG